uniref:SLBP_RNA_bind domain-containing protein n=2 Tax=Macrostomum lignano TaxID=282301 RepID=A0A1I8G1L4_9PLAT
GPAAAAAAAAAPSSDCGNSQKPATAASDRPHAASVPACDDGVWRATYTGLSNDERQRRSARYQQQLDERYSAKLPNRFSSVNFAQQW